MDPRPIEQWVEIFNKLPAPLSATVEEHIANRIMGDMLGYRHSSKYRVHDTKELANALQAYARIMQEANVKA